MTTQHDKPKPTNSPSPLVGFLRLSKKVVPLHHKTKKSQHERVNFRH